MFIIRGLNPQYEGEIMIDIYQNVLERHRHQRARRHVY